MDLIADIGATNTRCALLDDKGRVLSSEHFENESFTGVEGVLRVYLDHRRASDRPRRAALAVAAPMLGDEVRMVNIDWRFKQSELKENLGLARLSVVNDFTAVAWGLPELSAAGARQVGGGISVPRTPLAVLGPGSGLGVSGLLPALDGWTAISGEGGHQSLAPRTVDERAAIRVLSDASGHCSAEEALSGPGLVRLYRALAKLAGRESAELEPTDVTALARQGEPLATKTLGMFFELLGTVAADLALILGARGGVYIAGGIVPSLLDAFVKSGFRERFVDRGRYRAYLEAIPTYVVTEPLPAFRGLRSLLGYR
jgi:glucokinase